MEANMKIIDLVTRHPEFFENLLAKSIGQIGELLVGEELIKKGFSVRHKNNNSKQSDLNVTSPKGISFSVEVKCGSQRRPTWFVKNCPDPAISQFWFFISAPRSSDELPNVDNCDIFILTGQEVHKIWIKSPWNEKNPNNGDIRRHQLPDDAKSAWLKLPE